MNQNNKDVLRTARGRIQHLERQLCASSLPAFAVPTHQTVQLLAAERQKAQLNVEQLSHFLDGGKHITLLKNEMMQDLKQLMASEKKAVVDQTLAERRRATVTRVAQIYQWLIQDMGVTSDTLARRNARVEVCGLFDMDWYIRNGVHFGLFLGAILSQGDELQSSTWAGETMMLQVYGCFAMTELGHGSFVRGLETTATYVEEKDGQEGYFLIHSPTLTSTKYWIGAAAETATHAIVFAQLYHRSICHGVHSFIVQLRDTETHDILPGVHVGDCGAKMGLHGVDNGWLQFNQVRIPYNQMLCKYAHINLKTGEYEKKGGGGNIQMAYTSLISTRGDLIMFSCNMLKKALTISIRYAAIRTQGNQEGDTGKESCLLDYQSHQQRLIPLLSLAYAFHFLIKQIRTTVVQLTDSLDDQNSDSDKSMAMKLLADVHGNLAGLKAFSTWATLQAIDECRQCCGGQGYSSYNGLSNLVADFAVMVTWEGDNTVMAQQTARYLVSSYRTLKSDPSSEMAGSVSYLSELKQSKPTKWQLSSPSQFNQLTPILDLFRYLVYHRVEEVAIRYEKELETQSELKAWNECQVELIDTARVHIYYNIGRQFVQQVIDQPNEATPILKQLCQLFLLTQLRGSDLLFCLQRNFVTSEQIEWIASEIRRLNACIREQAVPLVDAFNLSDEVLSSAIGSFDGDAYQHLMQQVSQKKNQPTSYYKSHLLPLFTQDSFFSAE